MEQNENEIKQFGGAKGPRVWSGVALVIAGCILLAYKMGAPIPDWVFTWPVLLIAIGIIIGIKSRFHNPGAFVMIIVGGVFLLDQTNPELNFHNYILPVILISVGLMYIMRPRRAWHYRARRTWQKPYYEAGNYKPAEDDYQKRNNTLVQEDDAEYVEINAIFGSVKRVILSKNFKGGELNCIMGGAEINLMKADIQNKVSLEVNNVFGGTKLIIPPNWNIKNEVDAIFGGIEDKRSMTEMADPGKVLVLHGACVFGGIEITNY